MAGTPKTTSLLGELKRRQVFKVGATYSVVAFVVIQVADVLEEALRLPYGTANDGYRYRDPRIPDRPLTRVGV